MTRGTFRAAAGIAATVLLLTGCMSEEGNGGDRDGNGSDGGNATATEMRSWEPCEVLQNLQPFVDYMGIAEFTGTQSAEAPDSAGFGEASMDPDAMICGAGIQLDSEVAEGSRGDGQLRVKIVPLDDEEMAIASYDSRVALGGTGDVETANIEFGDPWDSGVLLATTEESGATEYINAVARDGQWVLHVELSFTGDFSAQDGGEPSYPFTNDELHQWLIDTYFADVNQAVNDRIAEGTGS